jgi:hypothetical protein
MLIVTRIAHAILALHASFRHNHSGKENGEGVAAKKSGMNVMKNPLQCNTYLVA